jgi:hypothetical protein
LNEPQITIITPTTGRDSLERLQWSLMKQKVAYVHLTLWDDKREGDYFYPDADYDVAQPFDSDQETSYGANGELYRQISHSIEVNGNLVHGHAYGSALRAVGLMAANTPYVTFADDDVWYDENHLEEMLKAIQGKSWACTRRRVWTSEECIGEDHFESVGEDSPLPYKMFDNSCMMFDRRFGTSAACLYRETKEYNDDRLMYQFLMKHGGIPGLTNKCTINQICPEKLEPMFKQHCTKTDMTGKKMDLSWK